MDASDKFSVKVVHNGQDRELQVEAWCGDPMYFGVSAAGEYLFTLVPRRSLAVEFGPAKRDLVLDIEIDWGLLEKVGEAIDSHYL
jgi:hypothetical protein